MTIEEKYNEIYALMERGEFPVAVRELTKLADDGEAKAAYLLGYMFYTGKGVEPSHDIAIGFLKASAKQGFAPAIKLLAGITRRSAAPNEAEVAEIKKKADAGDAKAAYKYAMLCMKGEGVLRDKFAAIDHFSKAAAQGHFLSMVALFDRFAIDADVEKQWSRAYYWFKQAWLIDRDRLNIVHPNIIKGEQLFLEAEDVNVPLGKRKSLLEEAARQGFHGAYTAYGDLCDSEDAIGFYEKGVEFGDVEAIARLRDAYRDGRGVDADENNAAFYSNEFERLSAFVGK